MMDPLDLTGTEGALAKARGQLRELRQELQRLEERKLVGQDVDENEYAAVKEEIGRLGRESAELARLQSAEDDAEFDTGGAWGRVMDFVVDYKIPIGALLFILVALGIMFAVSQPQVTPEERAKVQAQMRREAEIKMKAQMGDAMNAAESAQMRMVREIKRVEQESSGGPRPARTPRPTAKPETAPTAP